MRARPAMPGRVGLARQDLLSLPGRRSCLISGERAVKHLRAASACKPEHCRMWFTVRMRCSVSSSECLGLVLTETLPYVLTSGHVQVPFIQTTDHHVLQKCSHAQSKRPSEIS